MADDRTSQIREGAGLEESRLSQDTIDLLSKWGWPLLMILALIGAGYAGLNYLHRKHDERVDTAHVQLRSAEQSQSPDALVGVATDFSDVGAVPHIARLEAADIHLHAARTRLAPGAQLNADGTPIIDPKAPRNADGTLKDDPVLNDDQRKAQLDAAARLYKQVADETQGKPAMATQTFSALLGLAAVAECRADFDAAKGFYTRAIDTAKAASFPDLAAAAKARLDSVDSLKTVPRVYAAGELFGAIKPAPPPPVPAPIKIEPVAPPAGAPGTPAPATPDTSNPTAPPAPAEPKPADPPPPATPPGG